MNNSSRDSTLNANSNGNLNGSNKDEIKSLFNEGRKTKSGKILVSDLIDGTTERDLKELFSKYGQVREVKIPKTKNKNNIWEGKGIAYVTFWNEDDAKEAAYCCNNTLWNYTRIRVKIIKN